MTTYRGGDEQLAIAQAVLDRHATSSATGFCLACGVPGPCLRNETAATVFMVRRGLPRRVPGLSRPELIGARPASPTTTSWHAESRRSP